ncbi:MAG: glycosyltransferase family 4 protein [Planctomycetes bacterium]|nr:glycosyltransferase family 4 protein [Planctomycetota bacterium]
MSDSIGPTSSTAPAVRVGYLLRMYPRFSQTFVVNEILELERQSVEVSIASLKKPSDGRFHESISRVQASVDYIPEHLVESPAKTLRSHWAVGRRQPLGYARALGTTLRFAGTNHTDFRQAAMVLRWAHKRKIKHIHVHFGTHEASVAYLACLIGGLSYSQTLHAFDIFRDDVDRRLLARKINASRFTVTVSEFNRRYLVKRIPGVDPAKVRVNYNGIDLEAFSPNGAARTPHSIVSIGRLIEKKGFIHLIRAVRRLRDRGVAATCTIVGDGRDKDKLKREIKALKLRGAITLAGSLNQDQVRDLLKRSACLALPCVEAADGNVDALPTVLLEGLACGCPCISTKVSGVPEIIENEISGLLVAPSDDAALSDALARVLQSPELHRNLATGGRRRAEQLFDVRQNVARMKGWFADVLSAPTREGEKRYRNTDGASIRSKVEVAE